MPAKKRKTPKRMEHSMVRNTCPTTNVHRKLDTTAAAVPERKGREKGVVALGLPRAIEWRAGPRSGQAACKQWQGMGIGDYGGEAAPNQKWQVHLAFKSKHDRNSVPLFSFLTGCAGLHGLDLGGNLHHY